MIKAKANRRCVVCGQPISEDRRSDAKNCSRNCKDKSRYLGRPVRDRGRCVVCRRSIPTNRVWNAKTCGPKCRYEYRATSKRDHERIRRARPAVRARCRDQRIIRYRSDPIYRTAQQTRQREWMRRKREQERRQRAPRRCVVCSCIIPLDRTRNAKTCGAVCQRERKRCTHRSYINSLLYRIRVAKERRKRLTAEPVLRDRINAIKRARYAEQKEIEHDLAFVRTRKLIEKYQAESQR